MGRVRQTVTGCAAFLSFLFVSCAQPDSAQPASDTFSLNGTEWVLESLNGQLLLEDTNITLEFDGGRYGGYSGCNFYGGEYRLDGTNLRFLSGPTTAIGCDRPILQQEERYARAFRYDTEVGYRVSAGRLELLGADNTRLVFVEHPQLPMNPDDLVGTKWRLRAVSGEAIPADALVTLNFSAAGIFNGVLGCIDYSGKYTAEGDDIWFGEHGHDYARCRDEEESDGVEAELTVSGVTDYRLSSTELELLTFSGGTLLFTAR
ncbi:MAG: hypothetical protein AVDCRST_MAG86-4132 [uncultured Truepera sp.]|uniref:DUF306 domain-containing protein n=1 Tax=uncultured Truepera sp. TaxID=543023 RepID=A0A6J4VYS6_9DEIN|nr:MAG: hypothetical protein AVDCRST_MAG86-4132 [uncultured Truepera sp.]